MDKEKMEVGLSMLEKTILSGRTVVIELGKEQTRTAGCVLIWDQGDNQTIVVGECGGGLPSALERLGSKI